MALTKVRGSGIDADGQEVILDADADTTITADTDDQIDFKTAGADKMTVKADTVSIKAKASSYEGLELITPSGDGSGEFHIGVHDDGGASGRTIVFSRGGSDGMDTESSRIDNNGDMFVGTTLDMGGKLNLQADGVVVGEGTSSNEYRRMYWHTSNNQLQFWNGSNECVINSSGAFTDASDEKLKKDIVDITYGIDAVKALKPRKYKMKATNKEEIGFIAQEVEPHIPQVVGTGTNPDGVEQKTIAYQHLTAVLTKALQEAIAKIETLETKVKALEEA